MPSPHASGSAGDLPRTGWPLLVDDSTSFSLSPLLNNLPSITGISEMSGINRFFPKDTPREHLVSASWAVADLDGRGERRLLLLTSPVHALQVFAYRDGVIPDDPQVTEVYPPPEEVVSIPALDYEGAKATALPGVVRRTAEEERVLSAHVLDKAHWQGGPAVGLISVSTGHLALTLVDLTTGKGFRRLELGKGNVASVSSSSKAVVVSLPDAVHVLNSNLDPLCPAITGLAVHPATLLPITSLSGRLLAYTTDEAAAFPGPDGLGSITTAFSRPKEKAAAPPNPPPQTTQGAILTSAVEIGGGVARGVWAGIKMGARAANDVRNNRLASSAPTESVLDAGSVNAGSVNSTSESRSAEDRVAGGLAPKPQSVWVKIVDVASGRDGELNLVAHFRLPPSRQLVPGSGLKNTTYQPIGFMSFSPQGSRLFVAPADGRAFHILDVRPQGAEKGKGVCRGEVWDQYVLRRGNTPATVSSASWSRDERWISVGTGRGTIHVFAITPGGSRPSSSSQVPLRIVNSPTLQPLGVELSPVARLRPPGVLPDGVEPAEAEARIKSLAFATFTAMRRKPVDQSVLCQDIAVYRSGLGQLELVRLDVKPTSGRGKAVEAPTRRRGSSNLTEMLREKSGLAVDSDFDVDQVVKARWALPLGGGDAQVILQHTKNNQQPDPRPSHAEIRTHSASAQVLPSSIYLCHQAEFFAAVPTDEYQPLSVLDKVARTKRLVYRAEVEMSPPRASPRSLDEPLSTALHSVLDSKPSPQLPRLPNGSPSRSPWGSVPIRLAANLGEGVDRVRREYVRAQMRKRRASDRTNGTPLSFEDDTVFASAEDDDISPPSSGPLPPTVSDMDEDWGERWEDEYRRAVEDDGGPDDLVLGMLDEEERWSKETKEKNHK